MSRPKSLVPTYRLHKQSGQAYTYIDGRQRLLGTYDTPQSRAAYDRILAEYFANGRRMPTPPAQPGSADGIDGPTVSVLVEAFWTHARTYYVKPKRDAAGQPVIDDNGKPVLVPSDQLAAFHQALIPLQWLYGQTPAVKFGCAELEAIRNAMARPGEWRKPDGTIVHHRPWCRTNINMQVGRLRHVFAWGVTKKLVPASVHAELVLLPGLRRGKSEARETKRVKPVSEGRALAIVPHVARQVGVMIQVQLLTGMRSTELCIMRPIDIDQTTTPWVYRPMFHKTEDQDVAREVAIGPKARALLTPFMSRDPNAFLFCPAEAMAELRDTARKNRKTNVQPSQVHRAELAAARRRKDRQPGIRYDKDSYRHAIRRGCEKAFNMPAEMMNRPDDTPDIRRDKQRQRAAWHRENSWFPHQVRHRAATDARRTGGMEAAQIMLGHTSTRTTEIYAEADVLRVRAMVEANG